MESDDDTSPQDVAYAEALARLDQGDYRAAEDVLLRLLDQAPRAAQSVYLLGVVKLGQRDLRSARASIDRAFRLKPWVRELAVPTSDLCAAIDEAAEAVPDWVWPKYDRARRACFVPGLTFENVCRLGILDEATEFVQVGANDGVSGDPIRAHVLREGWRGLLVEPLPDVFARLVSNYAGADGLQFANVAVATDSASVTMYVEKSGRSTLASMVPDRNALSRSARGVSEVTVPGQPLMELLEEYSIGDIDLLQIDAEGYDFEILRQYDFNRHRPKVVHMEFYCLPIEERLATFDLLVDYGYVYRFLGRDLVAVRAEIAADLFGSYSVA